MQFCGPKKNPENGKSSTKNVDLWGKLGPTHGTLQQKQPRIGRKQTKKTRKFSKIETSNKKGSPGLKTKSHHSEGKFIIYCHLFDPTLSHDSPFNNLFKIIAVIFEVMNQATFDFHDFLLQGGGRTFTSKGPKDAVWSHDEWPIWKSDAVLVDVL